MKKQKTTFVFYSPNKGDISVREVLLEGIKISQLMMVSSLASAYFVNNPKTISYKPLVSYWKTKPSPVNQLNYLFYFMGFEDNCHLIQSYSAKILDQPLIKRYGYNHNMSVCY